MPEKTGRAQRPFSGRELPGSGFSLALGVILALGVVPHRAEAGDGATEALELRLHAERAIAEESAGGRTALANAMTEALPGLLLEYLASRDETIALDVVDAAFVREQIKVAELMQEPGLALALDVFAGPGTGYEHGLRTALANLADYRQERAVEAVLDVYERQLTHHEEHLERLEEVHRKVDEHRLEAQLVSSTDRLERKAETSAGKAEATVEKAMGNAEQAAGRAAQAIEKIEQNAQEKAEEKTDKKAEGPTLPPVVDQPKDTPKDDGKKDDGKKDEGKKDDGKKDEGGKKDDGKKDDGKKDDGKKDE